VAHYISFETESFWLNNRGFRRIMELGVALAEVMAREEERLLVEHTKNRLNDGFFWSGRNIDIHEDFPTVEERKLWARVFNKLSFAMYDRVVNVDHEVLVPPAMIFAAYHMGSLFWNSVRAMESGWQMD